MEIKFCHKCTKNKYFCEFVAKKESSEISEDFLLIQITISDYLISVINLSFGFLTFSSFSNQSFSVSL